METPLCLITWTRRKLIGIRRLHSGHLGDASARRVRQDGHADARGNNGRRYGRTRGLRHAQQGRTRRSAVEVLDGLLPLMEAHQTKKTSRMRTLHYWLQN